MVTESNLETFSNGWQIRQQLPGRVRLRGPLVRGDRARALGLEEELSQVPGVRCARVSASTGSVLLEYDPHTTGVSALIDRAERAHPRAQPTRRMKRASEAKDQASSLPVILAIAAKRLADGADSFLQMVSGGRIELKSVVIVALLLRVGLVAALSGPVTWGAFQSLVEFIVAWTLYQYPEAQRELQRAKDVASPAP